LSIPPLGHL